MHDGAVDTHPLWRPFSADSNATRQSQRVAFRQVEPGPLREYDSRWADAFGRVRTALVGALGPGTAITHVGSTAVPGMIAKPVIDVDVLVTDVLDEASWLPKLEEIGFRLVFRDVIAGDPHCQLTLGDPNTNLHVWRPDAAEPRRHRLFVSWLQRHPEDRRRYADAKAEAVRAAADGLRYNDAKAAVVYDLYERVFAADPDHPHAPRPRP
ncbi:hypothetical protein Csp2054_08260 [Curtobacterium sp. 'Ferrero']|uniref:GrpB family protein n=1 Tax=Curtobacterium sp. 'Ferrero' TaxID=2033654 RepID=UPI000BDD8DAC|nr:GrpB family protein [Curtobacterium sp. 'Ferrero']PCN48140.1 hypothetical protein Csp2054_08260 [Curtobacterium sp. 'Ferrero']